jgi:putative ABC transport system permease protein
MAATTWSVFDVDAGFIETLGLEMVAGRSFDRDVRTDEAEAFILNEAAVRALVDLLGPAWADPVGKKLDRYDRTDLAWVPEREGRIIGVVRDFHYASLHHRIAPLVMQLGTPALDHLVVRLAPGDAQATVAALEGVWNRHLPERPFESFFMDAEVERLYRAEARVTALMDVFTGLGLFIACLGLFGLAAFTAERRTKEIGVRKALGASVPSIVVLLSKEFTRLVLIAFFLAAPVAYVVMNGWLDGFAYRAEISWWMYAAAALSALAVAWLTVGYQSVKAALADPVDSLRYE